MTELEELYLTIRNLRADLGAAAVVIDHAYGVLEADEFNAIEQAKGILKTFIADQIENGGYKQQGTK